MTGKRLLLSVLCVGVLAASLIGRPAQAADISEEARLFIEIKGNEAIRTFGVENREERYARFRKLLTESFALNGIAKFVIGRFWDQATKEQQKRYLDQFETYIVANYAAKSWIVENVKLNVVKVTMGKDNEASVDTLIHIPHKENKDVALGFTVRKGSNGLKIVDLMVDHVSLIISHRSEFTSVMGAQGGDMDKFVEFLADRTGKLENTAKVLEARLNKQAIK
ncbi:MAG: hypothetical protein A3G18_08250 [Rhodospirillales bacterium RIFCSPLOWO2_12_FULL_58_28]|nr:MAG: hypothetical protein A3H92_09685 [Rhodospirillales bacterium RIFCSPLOWO2_02_FULL_58_16]OHC79129.1 MAG: hypothetical protein A3G18_08250 [Rhodospirillales bacterium RIFCSPLOWO2_12_FULL_58_28]